MSKPNSPAGAASATYRKVNNEVSQVLGKDLSHTRYPRLDFEMILEDIPASIKEKALEWYERGIRRGIAYATDRVADGTIKITQDKTLIAPKTFTVKVRTKFPHEAWESHEIDIAPEEVGFSK